MRDIVIVSAMICGPPRCFDHRLILSAYHGVWEAVNHLPKDIRPYVTDDVGNIKVEYGGLLQIRSAEIFEILKRHELYSCFRGVHVDYSKYIQAYPPDGIYENLEKDLTFVGWDIATSNGWSSASCEGMFPINPFTGEILDENIDQLNSYALFEELDSCLNYCRLNNNKLPENAPWYPVAVNLDNGSFNRLQKYL